MIRPRHDEEQRVMLDATTTATRKVDPTGIHSSPIPTLDVVRGVDRNCQASIRASCNQKPSSITWSRSLFGLHDQSTLSPLVRGRGEALGSSVCTKQTVLFLQVAFYSCHGGGGGGWLQPVPVHAWPWSWQQTPGTREIGNIIHRIAGEHRTSNIEYRTRRAQCMMA